MNVINAEDFWGLVGEQEYTVPHNTNPKAPNVEEAAEEILETVEELEVHGFKLNINDENSQQKRVGGNGKAFHELTGKHVDYKKIQAAKTSVGNLGECIVMEYLREKYEDEGVIIKHVSKEEGDGCGYDIEIIFPDEKREYIEVKTTKSSYLDGFYLTPTELKVAKECFSSEKPKLKSYHIYRIYNLDVKNKTADMKVFDNFNEEDFTLSPTCWKVKLK